MNKFELIKKIAKKLKIRYNADTYFVGGYVRDMFLGKTNKDIDIEIHKTSLDNIKKVLEEFGEVNEIGKSFGVLQIKGYDIDFSVPRNDFNNGEGHKDFIINTDSMMGTTEAARRRDFTINAIMMNVLTNEIIDPFNGIKDLENSIIRHVDNNTFKDDPLRVLRACQFTSRFEFNIHQDTLNMCKSIDIKSLSKERIFEELKKALLKSRLPSTFFNYLKMMNQLDFWFPELKELIDCNQNENFHKEGDVWTHTMMVLDIIVNNYEIHSEDLKLKLALSALFHDIGKPATLSQDSNGVYHNYNHGEIGCDIAEKALRRFTDNKDIIKYVRNMVSLHEYPHTLYNNKSSDKAFNKLFDKSIDPLSLVYLADADRRGKIPNGSIFENTVLHEKYNNFKITMSRPYVQGRDLIEAGYKPNFKFSEMLEFAHKCRLANLDKENTMKQIIGTYPIEED